MSLESGLIDWYVCTKKPRLKARFFNLSIINKPNCTFKAKQRSQFKNSKESSYCIKDFIWAALAWQLNIYSGLI